MSHRLAVVDGFSILYRSFFGVPALSTSQGTPTNALYGFASTLLRLVEDPGNSALVVVFDAPARNFRHDLDQGYKANRTAPPDDLAVQIPLVHELVEAFAVPILMVRGVEADDVIGTIACRAVEAGWCVQILSGDGDACQLVNDHVQVLYPRKGMELAVLDEAAVQEKFGVPPHCIPDWKALSGDASDNIPGVPGIGPKTAASLLGQFQTLENIYERLDEVSRPRWRELLKEHSDRAFLSKRLATIRTDVNITVDPEAWRLRPLDVPRLQEFFIRLEFRSLLRLLPVPGNLSSPGSPLLREAAECDYGPASAEELLRLVEKLDDPAEGQPVAIHVEKMSGGELALGVAPAPGTARYLLGGEIEKARFLLESPAVPKCVHNGKSAISLLAEHGIGLDGIIFDTAIGSYLLNPGRGHHHLDEVVFETLGVELQPVRDRANDLQAQSVLPVLQDDGEDSAKEHKDSTLSPALQAGAGEAGSALCRMVDCVGQAYWPLVERIQDQRMCRILADLEMPLVPILAAMERHGIAVNVPLLEALSVEMGKQIYALEQEIYNLAGLTFSIASTKQLQQVLFGKLQLSFGKTTRTGYSTDAETLKALAPLHPLPGRILAYRELTKLKSTYTDKLPSLVNPSTGRVHTSLNQLVTATGRLSSSEPNLQNIPVRTAIGRELRRAFIAPPGYMLLSADYSQIELRLLAHITGDQELLRAFFHGEDIHTRTAASLFGVAPGEVTPEMRRRAKTINFGLMYGMSAYGLAADLGITRSEAENYIQEYFSRFPGVRRYIGETVEMAAKTGIVGTLMGRKRYLPEINSRNRTHRQMAERAAINTPIQGTAADVMKRAMIRASEALRQADCRSRMILQVHDELVLEVPQEELSTVTSLVVEAMEGAADLEVPLIVDVRIGPNWGEMEQVRRVKGEG